MNDWFQRDILTSKKNREELARGIITRAHALLDCCLAPEQYTLLEAHSSNYLPGIQNDCVTLDLGQSVRMTIRLSYPDKEAACPPPPDQL